MDRYEHLKGTIAVIVILLGIGAAVMYATRANDGASATTTGQQTVSAGGVEARFSCDGGRSIVAIFSEREAHLVLSDGRELTIPQTVSGSGARYANENETFVFWNKGDSATIEEAGTMTYTGCTTAR